ncbi:class I SAM-dependent methyltransferase [Paludisphaera rhizosphaerae]|uniref:class I SAM-dependent methyltransferase n=1 Tax=Paludisphaera rhizosphaerae TaxID=2711216 RepID=UPI0013EB5E33|nr:class I SAM-dependent methyltransferase [Paludisphaera rhizosphaerae]
MSIETAAAAAEVVHRDDEYDSREFAMLRRMQEHHFWYRGRHRFLLDAVRRHIETPARIVDLGGGCGGWVDYLAGRSGFPIEELALADSSQVALDLAADALPPQVARLRVDLLNLPWTNRWTSAFLLDVIEHIPDHHEALRQVYHALKPGGTLFITVPALRQFWSWNDDFARHQRRYHRREMIELGIECGYEVVDVRYFMFLLSPILLLSRALTGRKIDKATEEERRELATKMHAVPAAPINELLSAAFGLETPLGRLVRFPWGTSLLAVLRKPKA